MYFYSITTWGNLERKMTFSTIRRNIYDNINSFMSKSQFPPLKLYNFKTQMHNTSLHQHVHSLFASVFCRVERLVLSLSAAQLRPATSSFFNQI